MGTRSRFAAVVSAIIASSASAAKADWDYWAITQGPDQILGYGMQIYTVDSKTGEAALRTRKKFEHGGSWYENSYEDTRTGELVVINDRDGKRHRYNPGADTWSIENDWRAGYPKLIERSTVERNSDGGTSVGQGNSIIQIAPDGNGLSTNSGKSLIRVASDGSLHIGENSLVTVEEGGVQKLYATDANGNSIPINITNGTSFLIDGVNVKSTLDANSSQINSLNATVGTHTNQINSLNSRVGSLEANVNNLGSGVAGATALSAAMTALPATSDDTPFSCGTGTGGYSNRYAMGFGCAARVTDRLAFNAGGSFVFGGASSYGAGTLDNVAGRLGFVFKIGKITPSSAPVLSQKTQKLEAQLSDVILENQKLSRYLDEMKKLIAIQNERLASLEVIANLPARRADSSHSSHRSLGLRIANASD